VFKIFNAKLTRITLFWFEKPVKREIFRISKDLTHFLPKYRDRLSPEGERWNIDTKPNILSPTSGSKHYSLIKQTVKTIFAFIFCISLPSGEDRRGLYSTILNFA
jgi:hypothetical protein